LIYCFCFLSWVWKYIHDARDMYKIKKTLYLVCENRDKNIFCLHLKKKELIFVNDLSFWRRFMQGMEWFDTVFVSFWSPNLTLLISVFLNKEPSVQTSPYIVAFWKKKGRWLKKQRRRKKITGALFSVYNGCLSPSPFLGWQPGSHHHWVFEWAKLYHTLSIKSSKITRYLPSFLIYNYNGIVFCSFFHHLPFQIHRHALIRMWKTSRCMAHLH